MATSYPSIEDFDDGAEAPSIQLAEDATAADFLAREQAALGTDAELFQQSTGANHDLLNGDRAEPQFAEFESSFPGVGPSGTMDQAAGPYLPPSGLQSGFGQQRTGQQQQEEEKEEPEGVKQWRERQQLEVQRRDEQSERRKQETAEQAKVAIDDFYDNYNRKKDKAIDLTRQQEKDFLDARESTVSGGTSWERIVKLIDVSDKASKSAQHDKGRFRELLLSLRKDTNAPGAAGV